MAQVATVDQRASREWASRPDDQRYLTLAELFDYTHGRAGDCRVFNSDNKELKAYGTEEGELILNTKLGPHVFNNWSFGQISQIAQAPGSYLRKLSSPLAAACLNEGLLTSQRDENMLMVDNDSTIRCATSTTYGRIWDHQIVKAVQEVASNGAWKVPGASYASSNPKRATTLYASDRDVFMFLVDEDHPVEVNGETLFRGFYAWNSEVGSQVFGLATFLYRYVCDNRMIWGQSNKTELRIKHSSGAPERFLREGKQALLEYSSQSTQPLMEQITRAQNIRVGKDEDEVKEFLKKRGLTAATADRVIESAKAEENCINTPWSLANGMTAYARSISHTDERVKMEREAGKLLDATVV